ncbi:MAG: PIG-L deacetylase family protein [Christensenellales bacterium]
MSEQTGSLLVIGAHPDDCEAAGGIALNMKRLGRRVGFLSVTDGGAGHQSLRGAELRDRRREEARRVSALTGIPYQILEIEDGALTTGLRERDLLMRAIRAFSPDAIITHRPCDYHPDHRATALLVQDCSYLLQVPNVCPDSPPLTRPPAIFHIQDRFRKPYPFQAELVFDVDGEAATKLLMYHQHTSQMYEWLPWVDRVPPESIPVDEAGRLAWLAASRFGRGDMRYADLFREKLLSKYGEAGRVTQHAEALEICEYGRQLGGDELQALFPF